ncbi:hypothetical protein BJY00DRAFT_298150 [Aspergillus carlsbadensis]|nr:hypothetical protein BJY00DRAFT_298150 [Aspergillus carlsbadensis]
MESSYDARSENELPSCVGCKKRKLKCSRQKPACSTCERLGAQCIYETRRNKPGLKSGAVEHLNQRLEKVERVLFGTAQSETGRSIPFDSEPTSHLEISAPSYDTAFSNLTAELRQLNRNLSSTLPLYQDQSANHLDSRKRRRREGLDPSTGISSDSGQRPQEVLGDLPVAATNDVIAVHFDELLNTYFSHVQPWIPIVREPSFRIRVQREEERQRLTIIIQAMAYAALRFLKQDGKHLPAEFVRIEASRLRRMVMITALDGLSIENLQALIIIAFTDEDRRGQPRKAWPIVGSLSRTVEYMELSVEEEDRQRQPSILPSYSFSSPALDWVEEEERRRVFWNVFLLDRWNTSLTAADISRRLPICGGRWYDNEPAVTPYLGIWDRSRADMGSLIRFSPGQYSGPLQSNTGDVVGLASSRHSRDTPSSADMSNVGAFAHFIEAMESLSQITTYFLQPRVDYGNRHEVSNWLTRFKELDLRLVHWRMFLPQQWKDSGVSREILPGVMDPNMTVANATHNISMILLHQKIAYPGADLSGIQVPSLCSAETCHTAAIETANIIRKYLETTPLEFPVPPQMGICAFVSAKVLLIHWNYYKTNLAVEFSSLVDSLEKMSRRWSTNDPQTPNLFSQLFSRISDLHQSFSDIFPPQNPGSANFSYVHNDRSAPNANISIERSQYREGYRATPASRDMASSSAFQGALNFFDPARQVLTHPTIPGGQNSVQWPPLSGDVVPSEEQNREDELVSISQILMNKDFLEMDRVFKFGDLPSIDDLPDTLL